MGLTVAEQLVEMLKSAGIRRIYGVTGDSLNFFNDALRRDGSIDWIHVRHEEAGAYAAMAEGVLGDIGCCAGSSGPGHVHLINGLYDAHRWGAPVLALPSTITSEDYGTESFQSTDLRMFDGCSHYNEVATTPQQLPRMLQQALQHAWNRKGVGICAFPGDLMTCDADDDALCTDLYRPQPVMAPSDAEIQLLAELINSSDDIGIYAGIGCADARAEVIELARLLKAPVAYTLKAKMMLEYDNPYAVGLTGLLGNKAGARAITGGKLLLMLGSDFPWKEFLNSPARIVQIDTKPERLGRRVALYMGLCGDIGPTLRKLLPLIDPKVEDVFLSACLTDYVEVEEDLRAHAADPGEENLIKPEFVAAMIDRLADVDAIFTADTGMSTVWAARYLYGTGKRTLLGSFSHGSMANAMPQSIGAALHSPERQVIAFCGDGGISMLMGDLVTIAQYKLPIKLIVFNNRSLGMVELEMQVAGLPDWQTKMINPDFAMVAEACGIRGYSVTNPAKLENVLQVALLHNGPALVNVFTNPHAPTLPPHTSVGVMSRYIQSQAKLALGGRMDEVWDAFRTNIKYIRDL
ncbi:pyruvate dehydrogenase (quinone) [Nitrosomonas sp. Nm84]|uniref:thiamine pyrophosphate-dependent enzyme n=1 Tax=Nitrosomonas sp. Nm84 TaxID=200124 RepID=UPI000D771199|nr:thiamine pyrophosphate-dependent enzyme [Nitrosomonas sp. Nm84]PXW91279.1 pyruvate dehydrogenase (quinone) [Nitrosomonas sp. Nm84]